MLVKTLNQTNPCLDREHLLDLLALYEGGKCFEQRLQRFLPRNLSESDNKYNARLKQAPYRSYIGPIIDKFAAMLLSSPPNAQVLSEQNAQSEPDEYWLRFRDDVDACGTDLREFFREQFTDALMKGRAIWEIRKPQGEASSKAEWDELGLGNVTLKELEGQDIINWKVDVAGRLEWLVYHEKESVQDLPTDEQGKVRETWTIYYRDRVDTFAITYEQRKGIKDTDTVPLVSSVPHELEELPLVCLSIPKGLFVAERLYSPQLEHFRLSAALSWAFKASCYAMPVFKTQDGKPPVMGEGNTITLAAKSEDGGEESIDWLRPPTEHLSVLREEISDQKDEIYRVVHQMAESATNNAAAAARSALSKVQDSKSTNIILESYSTLLRDAILKTYKLASRMRGENIDWIVTGLDRFEGIDLAGLIEAVEGVDQINIPSETFAVEVRSLVVDELLTNIDEQTRSKIRNELKTGIKEKLANEKKAEQNRLALVHSLGGSNGDDPTGQRPPEKGSNDGGGRGTPFGKRPVKASAGGQSQVSAP